MSGTQNDPAPAPAKMTTLAEMQAAYPALCTELGNAQSIAGATAERTRILGIEALGAQMKGHEKLIAELKADASVSPEQAAVRIIGAENVARAQQLNGIKAVEDATGRVNPAPKSGNDDANHRATKATTPDGWKAEYEGSDALKSEFAGAEQYVAFKKAESEGRVKVLRKA